MHKLDYPLLTNSMMIANNYGVNLKEPSFEVDFIDENTLISLGSTNGISFLLLAMLLDIFVYGIKKKKKLFLEMYCLK